MSILNTSTLCYTIFFLINHYYFTTATSTSTAATVTDKPEPTAVSFANYTLNELIPRDGVKLVNNTIKGRYKRQVENPADKFKDAASSSSLKSVRQFLQMVKNLFTSDPAGGNHPLSPDNPKIVVRLFKSTIYAQLFPEPGQGPETQPYAKST